MLSALHELKKVRKAQAEAIDITRVDSFYFAPARHVVVELHFGIRRPIPVNAERKAIQNAAIDAIVVKIYGVVAKAKLPRACPNIRPIAAGSTERVLERYNALKRARMSVVNAVFTR
jgi:hypothetical protein